MLYFIRFSVIIGTTFLIIYLLLRFSGSWKKTCRKVALRYLKLREENPQYTEQDAFFALLDKRYPNSSLTRQLFTEKEKIKEIIKKEIVSPSSFFSKYDLLTLVYCCLVIERNSILRRQNKEGIKKLLNKIAVDLNNQPEVTKVLGRFEQQ